MGVHIPGGEHAIGDIGWPGLIRVEDIGQVVGETPQAQGKGKS